MHPIDPLMGLYSRFQRRKVKTAANFRLRHVFSGGGMKKHNW